MQVQRRIRSFVLRAGRVTPAQERALAELWPLYGLDSHGLMADLDTVFGRTRATNGVRRILEIGFGTGEVIGSLAKAHPENDHLGIEVHRSGVGRLLLYAGQEKLANLRVICQDAVEALRTTIRDESFDEVLIFFPDPWHKKRHQKRRLIDGGFVDLLASKMAVGAILRLGTDWQDYAEQMLAVCNASERLMSLSAGRDYVDRPDFRPLTRFEKRGARLGHGVWDLAYIRKA